MNVDANQLYFPSSCPSTLLNMVNVSFKIIRMMKIINFISLWNAFDFRFILETKPKFEVNQTYPTCSFSEHAFCAAPVMRNFTNKGCDCFPGAGISCHMTHVMEWSVNPCSRLSIGPFHRWKYNLRILAISTSNSRFFKNWSIYRDRGWVIYDHRLVK